MEHFFDEHSEEFENYPDQSRLNAAVKQYLEKRAHKKLKREQLWGEISKFLVMLYVTVGGGYEIISGILSGHVNSTFVFSFLSSLIFVGRVLYGFYSGARKTMWADVYGAAVMLLISVLHVIINGTFL